MRATKLIRNLCSTSKAKKPPDKSPETLYGAVNTPYIKATHKLSFIASFRVLTGHFVLKKKKINTTKYTMFLGLESVLLVMHIL